MNHEGYSDPTADIAVERVYREWLKEVRKNGVKRIFKDDTRAEVSVWEKRTRKSDGNHKKKKRNEGNIKHTTFNATKNR